MARQASDGGPTKTQRIEEFYAQGITVGKDILAKMEEAGQPTTISTVYGTISNMKKKSGTPKGKRGRTKAEPATTGTGVGNGTATRSAPPPSTSTSNGASNASVRSNGTGSVTLEDLSTIAALAKRVGGVDKLRAVVESLASFA